MFHVNMVRTDDSNIRSLESQRMKTNSMKAREGKIRADTLQQAEFWYDITGRKIRIRDMEPQYISNVLNYLWKKRKTLKFMDENKWCMIAVHHDGGEMAQDALDDIADRLLEQRDEEWFEEQPLIIELRKRDKINREKLLPESFVNAIAKAFP